MRSASRPNLKRERHLSLRHTKRRCDEPVRRVRAWEVGTYMKHVHLGREREGAWAGGRARARAGDGEKTLVEGESASENEKEKERDLMSWHDPLPVCDGMAPMVWTHPHHPIQSYNTVRVHSLSLTMSLSLVSFSVSISLRLSLRLSVCRATAGDALRHLPLHTQKQSTAAIHFYFFLSLSFPCLGPSP